MNKADIITLLETNDRAVARALVVLNELQTIDEQARKETRMHNGRGFRPCHARMGTSMATFFERNGYLSPKQLAYWRVKMKCGNMRVGIYAGQLLLAAEAKAKIALNKIPTGDVGNLSEELMVLEERYDTATDKEADVICDRMLQIKEQLEEIARTDYKLRREVPQI